MKEVLPEAGCWEGRADWVGSDEDMLDEERREGLYDSAEAQEGGFVQPLQLLDPELFWCAIAQHKWLQMSDDILF